MFAALLGLAVLTPSCDKDSEQNEKTTFEGKPTFELKVKEGAAIAKDAPSLTVTLSASRAMEQEVNLNFALDAKDQAPNDLLSYPTSVVLSKGEETKTMTIKLKEGKTLAKGPNGEIFYSYSLRCSGITGLDMQANEIKPVEIVVKLAEEGGENASLLEKWKQKFNVDLTPFIGTIPVETTVKTIENDKAVNGNMTEKTYKSQAVIALSDQATEDKILIDMPTNAMGLNEFQREALYYTAFTYMSIADGGCPEVWPLMQEFKIWSKDSKETFNSFIRGIEVKSNEEITFVRSVHDVWYDEMKKIVPFEYEFLAEKRLRELLKTEKKLQAALLPEAEHSWKGTPAPFYYLNHSRIDTDDWKKGMWVKASAKIDLQAKTLTFIYCYDIDELSGDYIQIKTVYKGK